jgi:hypothetical protein
MCRGKPSLNHPVCLLKPLHLVLPDLPISIRALSGRQQQEQSIERITFGIIDGRSSDCGGNRQYAPQFTDDHFTPFPATGLLSFVSCGWETQKTSQNEPGKAFNHMCVGFVHWMPGKDADLT